MTYLSTEFPRYVEAAFREVLDQHELLVPGTPYVVHVHWQYGETYAVYCYRDGRCMASGFYIGNQAAGQVELEEAVTPLGYKCGYDTKYPIVDPDLSGIPRIPRPVPA